MLFHWMWEFAYEFRMEPRALSLAYGLLGESLEKRAETLAREDLQCYASAALWLAHKFEGTGPRGAEVGVADFIRMSEETIDRCDLDGAELDVADDAGWRLHRRLPFDDLGDELPRELRPRWDLCVAVLQHAEMAGKDASPRTVIEAASILARRALPAPPTPKARRLCETIEADARLEKPYSFHARKTFRLARPARRDDTRE